MRSPDGTSFGAVDLDGERIVVGRQPLDDSSAHPEVALPDPETLVSRVHCVLERQRDVWYVVDMDSRNGTFLRRGETLTRVDRRTALADGDVVCIVGRTGDDGSMRYWALRFADPLGTREAKIPDGSPASVAYDQVSGRLTLYRGADFWPIHLTPLEHRLVGYMTTRNAESAGTPVLCTRDELLDAVWTDEPFHTHGELNRLVWGLRQKLALHVAEPLVETERGLGYRLQGRAERRSN